VETTIQVDGLPKSPNQTAGKHWGALYAEKQQWQTKVAWLAKAAWHYFPMERAHLHFTICTGDKRRHDPDNLNWAVTKPALDGLKGIVIADDSIDNVSLSYEYTREGTRGFRIKITKMV